MSIFMGSDETLWRQAEQLATDQNSKATVLALKLVAARLDMIYDAVVLLRPGEKKPEQP